MLSFVFDTGGSVLAKIPEQILEGLEEDYLLSFFAYICLEIYDTCSTEFHMTGFGVKRWPTEVYPEFSMLLEELPALVAWLQSGSEEAFVLELCEQGMTIDIHFIQSGGVVTAECHDIEFFDSTSGRTVVLNRPHPEYLNESMQRAVLEEQLLECARGFLRVLGSHVKIPYVHFLLEKWLEPLDEGTIASLGFA